MKGEINKAVGSLQGLLEFEWQTVVPHALDADNGQRTRGCGEWRRSQCLPAMITVVIEGGGLACLHGLLSLW